MLLEHKLYETNSSYNSNIEQSDRVNYTATAGRVIFAGGDAINTVRKRLSDQ